MKWIGLIGGMSIESSIEYERIITEQVRARLGGTSSPRLIHVAVDFAEVERLQEAGDWDGSATLLTDAARRLLAAGAEVVVLCTNTMHRVAPAIEGAIGEVPFLHLADATAREVTAAGIERVGLLGTRYTMELDFYRGRLADHGLEVLVPDEPDRTTVHDIIYHELVVGTVHDRSRSAYQAVVDRLVARGAQGVIAGCTEIELLLGPDDVAVPYFPTTRLHAVAAAEAALADVGT